MVSAVAAEVPGSSELFDGTQPLHPPQLFPDPLAGLLTGESSQGVDPRWDSYDTDISIAKPVEGNRESARAMMEAAFGDQDEDVAASRPKAGSSTESSAAGQAFLPVQRGRQRPPTGPALPGMLPPPERQPAGQRVRQALRTYPHPQRSQVGKPQPGGERRQKQSRSMSGVVVALILIAIFGIIAIQVLAGIIESISSVVE